jgi:hypothetical protein
MDRWRELMKISPPHFNQLAGPKAPQTDTCDEVWDQDDRDALAETMVRAEELIAQALDFWPAPKFITDEEIAEGLSGVRSDWQNAELSTRWKYTDCFGTETLTLKQANAGVEYLDLDNDPFERKETAHIGTAIYADLPACSTACEVAVFFRVADGAEDAADPRWEIRPIKVDIDGSTMHITAESSLFVRPELWLLTEADCKGSDEPNAWIWPFGTTNLVTAVDVYCRTVNKQTPVTLYWDGVCDCPGICQHKTQKACAYVTDKRRGFFAARSATWDGTRNVDATPTYTDPPEKVFVNYRAGYPLNSRNCRMNANLEAAILHLTNVLLPETVCGFCDYAQRIWELDRTPVDPLTPEAASLPWPGLYYRGAVEAWRHIKPFVMGRGGKAGRGYW